MKRDLRLAERESAWGEWVDRRLFFWKETGKRGEGGRGVNPVLGTTLCRTPQTPQTEACHPDSSQTPSAGPPSLPAHHHGSTIPQKFSQSTHSPLRVFTQPRPLPASEERGDRDRHTPHWALSAFHASAPASSLAVFGAQSAAGGTAAARPHTHHGATVTK